MQCQIEDDEPRRLAPKPSATQMAIPQPAVPEVTLLWEGEESVYWRPSEPPRSAVSCSQNAQAISEAFNAPVIASESVPAARRPIMNSQTKSFGPVQPDSRSRYEKSNGLATVSNNRQPGQPRLPGDARAARIGAASPKHRPAAISTTSVLAMVCNSAARASTATSGSSNTSPSLNLRATVINSVASSSSSRDKCGFQDQDGTAVVGSASGHRMPLKESDEHLGEMRQASNVEQASLQQINPQTKPAVLLQYPAGQQLSPTFRQRGKIVSQNMQLFNSENSSSEQTISSEYNPLLYSSGRKPFQHRPSNATVRNYEHTPVLPRDPKTLVPRSVEFYDDSPITVHARRLRDNNKENFSPDIQTLVRNPAEITSNNSPLKNSSGQLVQYHANNADSPQLHVNSPDPFLCKIIEGKDQQIFQLHRVLENVLSKDDGRCNSSSVNSSQSQSSKCTLKKIAVTQTSFCEENEKIETRSVGVNTDFSWSDLTESLRQYTSAEAQTEGKPSTILKNYNSQKSCLIMQKNSNTSSVRFEDSDKIPERRGLIATSSREQVHKMIEKKAVFHSGNQRRQQCSCTHAETDGPHCDTQGRMAVTSAMCALKDLNDGRHGGHAEEGENDVREADTHAGSGKFRGCNLINPPMGAALAGAFSSAGSNNHREVSLTLREVVLTTIHEDPTSPQQSLHLDLPDYEGDTLHHQQQQQPKRPPSSCQAWEQQEVPSANGARAPSYSPRNQEPSKQRPPPPSALTGDPIAMHHPHRDRGPARGAAGYPHPNHNDWLDRGHPESQTWRHESHGSRPVERSREQDRDRHRPQQLAEYQGPRDHLAGRCCDDRAYSADQQHRPAATEGCRDCGRGRAQDGAVDMNIVHRNMYEQGSERERRGHENEQLQRRNENEVVGEQSRGGSGVTIYRNLMNNIEQLLQEPQQRGTQQAPRNSGACEEGLSSIQRQLQQFGLSFIEPRSVTAAAQHHRAGQPPELHESAPYQYSRNQQPMQGAESLMPLHRANATSAPHSTAPITTGGAGEFSVATADFLRKNGLLNSD